MNSNLVRRRMLRASGLVFVAGLIVGACGGDAEETNKSGDGDGDMTGDGDGDTPGDGDGDGDTPGDGDGDSPTPVMCGDLVCGANEVCDMGDADSDAQCVSDDGFELYPGGGPGVGGAGGAPPLPMGGMGGGPGEGECVDVDECYRGLDNCAADTECFNTFGGFACCGAGEVLRGGECHLPESCLDLKQMRPETPSGMYRVTSPAEMNVYCDMDADGGGWTIIYATDGSDGGPIVTSNNSVLSGNPMAYEHYTLDGSTKQALADAANETLFYRDSGVWLQMNSTPFERDGGLGVNEGIFNNTYSWPVMISSNNGVSAPAFAGWTNYDTNGGGDFGISMSPDGGTCSGSTVDGFDQHSGAYRMLNCGCQRQYLYSYSSVTRDGDAGYDVNTGLGDWEATSTCHSAEGGTMSFWIGLR